jgi:hypothetical protein
VTPSLLLALLSPQAQTAIEQTISHMTVEEKAAQLQSGATALPKAKLPAYDYWNEGSTAWRAMAWPPSSRKRSALPRHGTSP